MAYSESLAERIRLLLPMHSQIEEKRMFGGLCFLLKGNMLVGVWKDSLIARVGIDQAEEALLEHTHVKPMDITGKPMKGWLIIEADGLDDDLALENWIQQAMTFVRGLPAK